MIVSWRVHYFVIQRISRRDELPTIFVGGFDDDEDRGTGTVLPSWRYTAHHVRMSLLCAFSF